MNRTLVSIAVFIVCSQIAVAQRTPVLIHYFNGDKSDAGRMQLMPGDGKIVFELVDRTAPASARFQFGRVTATAYTINNDKTLSAPRPLYVNASRPARFPWMTVIWDPNELASADLIVVTISGVTRVLRNDVRSSVPFSSKRALYYEFRRSGPPKN